jgi:hypothetical protein
MSQRLLIHPHGTYSITHRLVLLTKCLEVREEQLQTRQMLHVISRALSFLGGTMNERPVTATSSPRSRDNFVNTQNDPDLRVHGQPSVVLGTESEDSASVEKDTNAPPKTDLETGCAV